MLVISLLDFIFERMSTNFKIPEVDLQTDKVINRYMQKHCFLILDLYQILIKGPFAIYDKKFSGIKRRHFRGGNVNVPWNSQDFKISVKKLIVTYRKTIIVNHRNRYAV